LFPPFFGFGGVGLDKFQIEEIKRRLDILDIVGDYVQLKKVGKGYRALCPFHSEKTPSFYVMPDRQFFHCFGCGKGGDVISFVMEIEGLSFPEAIELLANRVGVKFESNETRRNEWNLSEVMEKALKIYRDSLESAGGEVARRYLSQRRLSEKWWSRFEIGWAPPSWDYLWRLLNNAGIPSKAAIECGLVIEGQRGLYDRFRGRIIFPIRDVTGRLIGFGGRSIAGEGAKYINTPESPLFHKGRCLYLLNVAKDAMREKGRAILVEGYMDAIRLHISGFGESVASLGTALTEEQTNLISRFADVCYVCYDADTAGQEAAIRGMYLLQASGLQVKVVVLPHDADPDEFLSKEGERAFKDLLSQSLHLPLYHLKIRERALKDLSLRKKTVDELLESFSRISLPDLAPFMSQIAAALEIPRHALENMLLNFGANKTRAEDEKKGKSAKPRVYINESKKQDEKSLAVDAKEAALFALLWNDPEKRHHLREEEIYPLISDERIKTLVAALINGESTEVLEKRWLNSGDLFPLQTLALGNAFCEQFEEGISPWDVIVSELRLRSIKFRYDELYSKMLKGEANYDEIREMRKIASLLKGGKEDR
jgi:DNA primase